MLRAARGRGAGRLVPVRRLLARHRAPRRLRAGARRLRPGSPRAARRARRGCGHLAAVKVAVTGRRRLHRRPDRRRAARRRARGAVLDVAAARPGRPWPRARRSAGVDLIGGDVRDAAGARGARSRAPTRSSTWRRSSAIPPCARDPALSRRRSTSKAAASSSRDARAAGVARLRVRLDLLQLRPHGRPDGADRPRRASCAPVSLYAEQKVAIERELLGAPSDGSRRPACASPPSTASRAAHALRPDRQRVHARPLGRPAARGLRRAVLAPVRPRARRRARVAHGARGARRSRSAATVFNVGRLRRELPQARPGRADHATGSGAARSRYVQRERGPARLQGLLREDQRDDSASSRMHRVPDGIDEIVDALEAGRFGGPLRRPLLEHVEWPTAPDPAVRPPARRRATSAPSRTRCASGWLTMGPRTQEFEAAFAEQLGVDARRGDVELHGRTAPRVCSPRASAQATR